MDDCINLKDGWIFLDPEERVELLNVVEALGIAIDRSSLLAASAPDMTTEQRIQRMEEGLRREQRLDELVIFALEDEVDDRRRIQQVIIDEVGGASRFGDHIARIPDYIEKLFQDPFEMATEYVTGKMEDDVKDRILQETHGGSPATLEDAAAELVKQIPYLATKRTVNDYYRYKELFNVECQNDCQGEAAEEAHQIALAGLKNELENIREEVKDSYYGTSRIDWAKPGEAYDRAFQTLRRLGK